MDLATSAPTAATHGGIDIGAAFAATRADPDWLKKSLIMGAVAVFRGHEDLERVPAVAAELNLIADPPLLTIIYGGRDENTFAVSGRGDGGTGRRRRPEELRRGRLRACSTPCPASSIFRRRSSKGISAGPSNGG